MSIRRLEALVLVVAFALTAVTATAESPSRPTGKFAKQVRFLEQPMPIPDYVFTERLADGTREDRAMLDFRGRAVLLNFWATWCGVCAKELPKLDRIAPELALAGVDVVALSVDEEIDQASRALTTRGHTRLRVFHDSQKVLMPLLGVRGVPTTFVVGPDGLARAVVQGPADWTSPEAITWLQSLADQPRAKPRGTNAATVKKDSVGDPL